MKFEIPNEKKEIKIKEINNLKFCYFCNAYNIKNKWKNKSIEDLLEEIRENTILIDKKKGEEYKAANVELLDEIKFVYPFRGSVPVKFTFENGDEYIVELEYLTTICEECKKSEGTYHEAVIQLRGVSEEVLKELVKGLVEKEVFIKERVDKKEGIDLKVTNKKVARSLAQKLAKKYKLDYKLTSKLITYKHDKGKEIYRDFILLRKVPRDFVYYNGKFWRIENNKLVDIEGKERIPLPKDKTLLEEVKVTELEKISEDKDGAYFLDEDYETLYFPAKKVLKLERGQDKAYFFEE